MRKKITWKKVLLFICLAGISLTHQSHAKTFTRGSGGGTDTIPPVISLNGKDTVHVEILANYTEDGAVAVDNRDGNLTNAIVLTGTVNTNQLGVYVLTYTVKDVSGNQTSKIRVVIVADTQKPVISNSDANDSNEVRVLAGSIFINRTKVTDNYDTPNLVETLGAAGHVNTFALGIYPIEYNATDQSGTKAETKIFKFIVGDFLGPTILLNTLDTVIWQVNKIYVPVDPTVKDNFYPSSQVSLTRTSNVNSFKLGWYYEEYKATDGSGNITVRRRWIKIIDDEAPVINGKALKVALFSNPDLQEGLTITDNYDAPAILFPRLKVIFNNVNTSADGLYVVTFQVSDLSGNTSLPFERTVLVGSAMAGVLRPEENGMIRIYPNPTRGILQVIHSGDSKEEVQIDIYDGTGKWVTGFQGRPGDLPTFDLSGEASGLYTVRVSTGQTTVSRLISLRR